MLVGNNIALVIYGILFAQLAEPSIEKYITPNDAGILFIQTILSTLLILVTAEFLPKTVFRLNANILLKALAVPVIIFYVLLYPIAKFSVWVSQGFIRLTIKKDGNFINKKVNVLGKVDLNDFLTANKEDTPENEDIENEVKIFKNALEFSDVKVRECMIPRNEITAIDINDSIESVKKAFIETGFSKIIVYKDNIDNIVGYVHTLNIFKKPKSIRAAMTEVSAVPETMPANKLLNRFIKSRRSMVLVVDEFGGTAGIVTMEDVIEEIFGEIEDEHDAQDLTEKIIIENSIYEFSGRFEIDYLNEKYNLKIPESQDYETLAGYIFFLREEIPQAGEIVHTELYTYEILKVNGPKIETVKLIIEN